MKIIALLAFCFATLDSSVFAAECTDSDLMDISKIYSGAAADKCPDLTKTANANDYCSFTECLGLMSDMIDDMPDCTSAGVNIKEGLKAAIDLCDGGTADTSKIFTSASGSASTPASATATPTTDSTSSGTVRTTAPSSGTTTDTTGDKLSGNTVPAADGSSASSIGLALSSAVVAMTAFFVAF
ncbi:Elicitin [Phytophthora megakarya]|uniref:Elicitin n=1 Tax=Phytophthora megakarya TaxID=4795 RepID=A0A225VKA2_9STRA|nr:Elicitin [Phytophthora megakarya]